jgi:hypothetical protein
MDTPTTTLTDLAPDQARDPKIQAMPENQANRWDPLVAETPEPRAMNTEIVIMGMHLPRGIVLEARAFMPMPWICSLHKMRMNWIRI